MRFHYPPLAFITLAFLAACQTPAAPVERIVTQEVRVPVPVACHVSAELLVIPAWPDTREALQAAPDVDRAVRLLGAGRVQRDAYIAALHGALSICAAAP